MSNNDPHHHHHLKTSYHVLDKLTNKISAIKEDLTGVVKERSRSFSADRHISMSSTSSLTSVNSVAFSLQDDTQSIAIQAGQPFKIAGKFEVKVVNISKVRLYEFER
jgi:hypothetical protein